MQDKLLSAYQEQCKGKKTLIFNNGIETSKHVYAIKKFLRVGIALKELTFQKYRNFLDMVA